MLRNIDKLKKDGIVVQGSWFNKNVLMLNETINSTINFSRVASPDQP
jgi:hypothetical protein